MKQIKPKYIRRAQVTKSFSVGNDSLDKLKVYHNQNAQKTIDGNTIVKIANRQDLNNSKFDIEYLSQYILENQQIPKIGFNAKFWPKTEKSTYNSKAALSWTVSISE